MLTQVVTMAGLQLHALAGAPRESPWLPASCGSPIAPSRRAQAYFVGMLEGLIVEFAEVVYKLFLHLASDELESVSWLHPRGLRDG